MAKIAVELERALIRRALNGGAGQTTARPLAQGDGWAVQDVVCTSGPQDRPFEERHAGFSIAMVGAGSFQYYSTTGRELMAPGSLLLGNSGQSFECGHEHGLGDRCISFYYAPEYFERIAADAGACGSSLDFRISRLPPLRASSPLIARACAALSTDGPRNGSMEVAWEELSVLLAALAMQLANGLAPHSNAPPSAVARVTRVVRAIEGHPDAGLTLGRLAREAGLSPYHFLRTFQRMIGLTPHQYLRRARLREAAIQLADTQQHSRILDIALDCGFGDVSNFNRSFRAEFGVSPRVYRRQAGR